MVAKMVSFTDRAALNPTVAPHGADAHHADTSRDGFERSPRCRVTSDWMGETGGLRTCLVNRLLNIDSPGPASGAGRKVRECESCKVERVTGLEPATQFRMTAATFSLRVRGSRHLSSRGLGSPGTSGQGIMSPLHSRPLGSTSRCKGTRTPDTALVRSRVHRRTAHGATIRRSKPTDVRQQRLELCCRSLIHRRALQPCMDGKTATETRTPSPQGVTP